MASLSSYRKPVRRLGGEDDPTSDAGRGGYNKKPIPSIKHAVSTPMAASPIS